MIDLIGRQLGNYLIVRLLGRGGFADVYLGEHIHLKTLAAIKVLGMRLDSDGLAGFLKEARTIAHLEHPHIVRVLEFGVEPESNTPFLVMSYAPNGTLRQRYPSGTQVPLPDILLYTRQIASALQYAHNQKIIHRDVKPENMLLGRQGDIQLSDFGIALITQSSRYQDTRDVVGTVAYMAPEQLQGKPNAASDQYALAITVYAWLCGERPFQGTFMELFSQHTAVQPPPLHARFPFIPPSVEQVVLTALAKQPQERFPSVQAFAEALEQTSGQYGIIASDAPTAITPFRSSGLQPFSSPLPQVPASGPVSTPAFLPPSTSGSGPHSGYTTLRADEAQTNTPFPSNSQNTPLHYTDRNLSIASSRPQLNRASKILSIVALLTIVLATSSYLFRFPSSPFADNNPGGTATNSVQQKTATANAHTPTNYYPGQLIYEAKSWSKWKGSEQWKTINSTTYGSDGTANSSLDYNAWTPYIALPANYIIEAQITFVRCNAVSDVCEIELIGRGNGQTGGYIGGVYTNNGNTSDPHVAFISLIDATNLSSATYPLDHNPHMFRLELKDNTMTFSIDGHQICKTSDNKYLSPGKVGLRAKRIEVNVSNFKVYAL